MTAPDRDTEVHRNGHRRGDDQIANHFIATHRRDSKEGQDGAGAVTGREYRWKRDPDPSAVRVWLVVDGQVTRVEYHPGKFLPAYREEAGTLNEWTEVWFERQGRAVVCRQIVGILARRIVCRLKAGDTVTRGQRFGVMKFGSRIDLFVPIDARILVKAGDRVVAGETVLAQVP